MSDSLIQNIPAKPLKKDALIAEELDEGLEVLYVDTESDASFSLNSTASAILELCDGERSVSDITDVICETVGGDRAQVNKDTQAVLEEFYLHGIIA